MLRTDAVGVVLTEHGCACRRHIDLHFRPLFLTVFNSLGLLSNSPFLFVEPFGTGRDYIPLGPRLFDRETHVFHWSINMHISVINIVLSFAIALVLHELGHFVAARVCRVKVLEAGLGWGPKVFGARILGVDYHFRLLPIGAYVRMDMAALQRCPLIQQLFVLLAGIGVNLILAVVAWGSFFGTLNLVLAVANLFPIYQHDGWKSGMVFFRRVFKRPSPLVEWSFTLSPGVMGLVLVARVIFAF